MVNWDIDILITIVLQNLIQNLFGTVDTQNSIHVVSTEVRSLVTGVMQ